MSAFLAFDRSAGGIAARAVGHAGAGSALAAGLNHATTDSAVSWPALAVAALVLAVSAYPVLRAGASRWSGVALAAVQALLAAWLGLTSTDKSAAAIDGHLRLPSAWHHNGLAMAALNFLAAYALVCLLRSAGDLPVRLSHAVAATTRRWFARILQIIGLVPHRADQSSEAPQRALSATAIPSRPHSLTVLLYRVQPCGP
ncbi:hypothetical protein [Streptomyces canus]|uniref:hypothetical protein n=1 Tax=Streptomyces canus TaxID=58343 RepID=UPI0038215C03